MLEKALNGGRAYWSWLLLLLTVASVGLALYLWQAANGVELFGLSRDVPWGIFIANDTFMVGVAASVVMVVLPLYLHGQRDFAGIAVLGEFMAVAAVMTALLFVLADLGQPGRLLNILLYPNPASPFFWNSILLPGFLILNLVVGWFVLDAERHEVDVPRWVTLLVLLSIPWAIAMHTVTSFIYSGLPARPMWDSAILAPRFLASAFASGTASLIILSLVVRRCSGFDPGSGAIRKLATIVVYATVANLFLVLVGLFPVAYGGVESQQDPSRYLYLGLNGHSGLVPWAWLSILLSVGAIALLVSPGARGSEWALLVACGAVCVSMWMDKGFALVVGGFVPSSFGEVTEYLPTVPELVITLSVYAAAALLLTLLYKIAVAVKKETL